MVVEAVPLEQIGRVQALTALEQVVGSKVEGIPAAEPTTDETLMVQSIGEVYLALLEEMAALKDTWDASPPAAGLTPQASNLLGNAQRKVRAITGDLATLTTALVDSVAAETRQLAFIRESAETVLGINVTAASAVLGDNKIIRGDGGVRGVQDSLVSLDDAGAMSGLTRLTVDNLDLNGNTVLAAGALLLRSSSGDITISPITTGNIVTVATTGVGSSITLDSGGIVTLQTGGNANVVLAPGGTGVVLVDTLRSNSGSDLKLLTAGTAGLGSENINISAASLVGDESRVLLSCGGAGTSSISFQIGPDNVAGFLPGKFRFEDDYDCNFGTGDDAGLRWDVGGTRSCLQLGLAVGTDAQTGYFFIVEQGDLGVANRQPTGAVLDPTFRIYSGDATQVDDYIQLRHDQTNASIDWGNGLLELGSVGSDVFVNGNITLGGTVDGVDVASHSDRHMTAGADVLSVLGFHNGTFLESFDAVVTSNGTTITMSLEKTGTGDLTMVFSDGETVFDCTPAATIALTAGSDTAPQENFIYILKSTKALTKSTSAWPATEHIKVGYFLVQSASLVQTDGPLITQNWNDFAAHTTTNEGHLTHIVERLRVQHAIYHSGVAWTVTVTTNVGTPDNVDLALTAGVVYQLHSHATPASDTATGDDVHIVNDSVTPYTTVTDLNGLLTDSTGGSMSGKYFNLVVWAVVNKSGEHAPVMINLPGGSYNKQSDAEKDVSGFDDFSMPAAFNIDSSTGFLVVRLTFRHQVASGGTWTHVASDVDLRGQTPATAAGSGTASTQTAFADNQFEIFDESDVSKLLDFQLSGITTANTRTITMADQDIDLTPATGTYPLATAVLLKDGTVALTANWDAGSFEIRAQTFESDVVTGTAPLIVASTTVVTNLNADLLDGVQESALLLADGSRALTGAWAANNDITGLTKLEVDNLTLNGDSITDGTAGVLTLQSTGGSVKVSSVTGTLTIGGASGITIANSVLNTDIVVTFDGTTNQGTLTYMEDEDEFIFSSVTAVTGLATGGLTDYDLKVGDTTTPDYGMIQIGNSVIGRTSYSVGAIDLNGTMLFRNIGGPVTSEIEFAFVESGGTDLRFALAKPAVGNATINTRSMLIAGPAPADTAMVTVAHWQAQGIFDNLVCDTAGDGADVGIQNDLEVEGDVFVDSIKESTAAAGVTFGNNIIIQDAGTVKVNLDIATIINTVNAADMDGTATSILFRQFYYDAATPAVADLGRLRFETTTDWTVTASTQDSTFKLQMVHNGVMIDKVVALSDPATGGFKIDGSVECHREEASIQLAMFCHSTTGTDTGRMAMSKSNGTEDSPTAVVNGDRIGQFQYKGYDGTSYQNRASVFVDVDGTVVDVTNTVPMAMSFRTGTTSASTERLNIDSSGDILIPTSGAQLQFGNADDYLTSGMQYNTGAGAGHTFRVAASVVAEIDTDEIRLNTGATQEGRISWNATYLHLGAGTSQELRLEATGASVRGFLFVGSGHGAAASSALLELSSTTGALLVSRMTTTQRNALTAVDGMILYNTTTGQFNFREGGAWVTGSGLA